MSRSGGERRVAGVVAAALSLAFAAPAEAQLLPLPPLLPPRSEPPPPPPPPRSDRPARDRCRGLSSPVRPGVGRSVFPCDFPDPMVVRTRRWYYAYSTATGWQRRGAAFPVLRSRDLHRWRYVADALPRAPDWSDGDHWAPSVLHRRGRWYLYFSARRRSDHVHCLGVATGRGPRGPFRDRGPLACRDRRAKGYIDAAPLVHRRRVYLFFSVDRPVHSISMLQLRRDLLRPRGTRQRVIPVGRRWHLGRRSRTVEAPWPLVRRRRFYLFYSAGCWCLDYASGYASARRIAGPWRDSPRNPILSRLSPAAAAPGSGSAFRDRSGRHWFAFHAWHGPPSYGAGGVRTLRLARIAWRGARPKLLLRER